MIHAAIMTQSIHTSAALKAAGAVPFSTLKGKLDASLLEGLGSMGYEYMTPVQSKIMSELPSLKSDWYLRSSHFLGIRFR